MAKTFKTAELPVAFYMTFDDDDEVYDGELVEITDIDTENDRCVLIADGVMPQRAKLRVPYSALDSDVLDFGTGVKLFLDRP